MKVTGKVLNVIPVSLTTLGTTVMLSASRTAHCGLVTEMETRSATETGKVSVNKIKSCGRIHCVR